MPFIEYLEGLKKAIRPFYFRYYVWPIIKRHHKSVIKEIRQRNSANVVFIASNLAMWHLQGVYNLLSADSRFHITLLLYPLVVDNFQSQKDIEQLRYFFNRKGIHYIDASSWTDEQSDISNSLKPDILFYPKHYDPLFRNKLDAKYYYSKLLCYLPYAVSNETSWWAINSAYQNRAWKLFYETDYHKQLAQKMMYIKGENVVVVGNSDADLFLAESFKNVWKQQSHKKKRIIWAPHWSIYDGYIKRDGFLWLHDEMLKIARQYAKTIQIAFKPHPHLKSTLYNLPEWGQERTDAYYSEWQNLENGQLEEGEYIDLFMTSDAMIHDSDSFIVLYHYSLKPTLYTSNNYSEIRESINYRGKEALDAHYCGSCVEDVKQFINQVVLGGNDPKKPDREAFFQKYLLPPHGKTVAQNVYDDIVASLFG